MGEPEAWHPVPAPAGTGPRGPEVDDSARPPPLPLNWLRSLPEVRRGRMSFDSGNVRHWIAVVALGFVLLVLVGNAAVLLLPNAPEVDLAEVRPATLVLNLAANMVLLIGAPLVWVWGMYEGGSRAWGERLLLRSFAPLRDVFYGVGFGVLGLVLSWVLVLVVDLFTTLPTDNPLAEGIMEQATWPIIVFIAVASSTSEEVFFRGFLQARIGILATSVAFGFVHLSYGTPLQIVIPLMLGLLFAVAALRTRSIVPAVVAHFTFNFVQLAVGKLCADGVIDCTPM